MGAVEVDEVGGGGVVGDGRIGGGFELSEDFGGEDFAELDAPLVEGVDGPEDALGEDGVLVEGDELAQDLGSEGVGEEGVGGAIAFEDLVRDEGLGDAFGTDFGGGLAEGEGFGLGEDVGHQHVVMAAEGVKGFVEADEVAGDEAGALVDELVEAVLSVGAGLAPVDGAGLRGDVIAGEGDVLAVGLHGELLEIGGEALEVLLVGKNCDGLGIEEVGVPDGE